ncbi:MgtE protein [Paenibacillus sp. NPDC058174]|uniref:MgtE protein n=1 Tax=Paenibacillus sp. NPDC058174 TaxID=3346366 RepID=UPI0036D9D65B
MANADMEKESYNGFERMMFFVTPILFVVVLIGVVYILYNADMRNSMLKLGNSIPVLRNVLPEAKQSTGGANDEQIKSDNMGRKIEDLQAQLTEKENELAQTAQQKTAQEQELKNLQTELDQLTKSSEKKGLEDEQYQAKIQELAGMYGKITPSKAAPILQAMTLEDMVLVLEAMRPDDRVRVMEKMNPKTAADATVMLKDTVPAKDRQIAALQAELKKAQAAANATKQPSSTLDTAQLNATFSAMDPKSAAQLLIAMADVSPSKVLRILNGVDDNTRSAIVAGMSGINEKLTAQLVSKLMTGK